jgi:hypothetical protein
MACCPRSFRVSLGTVCTSGPTKVTSGIDPLHARALSDGEPTVQLWTSLMLAIYSIAILVSARTSPAFNESLAKFPC